jgi:uncharacterized DUF497 family protein
VRFDWSPEKNAILREKRGLSFETVVAHIEAGHLWKIEEHFNTQKYPNQKILYVVIESYVYLVPMVEDGEICFLKTIFPDRKATKRYHEQSE